MPYYSSVEAFREYFKQAGQTSANEELIEKVLARASSVIDGVLGFRFDGYTTATTKTLRASYGPYLPLPPHEPGSVTLVAVLPGEYDMAGYWQALDNGTLHYVSDYGFVGDWGAARYVVTANWGYGDPPESVVEAELEIAVRIYRARDAGFSDVVGVEGAGAVGYNGALPNMVKLALANVKRQYSGVVV